jgi:protocatechuate 3,4-dioxygenase alpha subunit
LTIKGRVLDGDSNGVGDAAIEIWHADSQGDYAERSVRGWGRVATDDAGGFQFSTMKPGRVAAAGDQLQAPHIAVIIFARGLLKHLLTRIYFPDERSNMHDPVLGLVPDQVAAL